MAIALTATAAGAAPALAEGVVLSSTAPGMTVGRVLADSERLDLPEDTVTTVLMPSGRILRIGGPYEGALPEQPQETRGFTLIGDWRGVDLSALGGTRSLGGLPEDTLHSLDGGPVTIDAARAGTWCLGPETPVRIAPPPGGSGTLTLAGESGGAATLSWPPAQGPQPWPEAVPLGADSMVEARWEDAADGHPMRLRRLDGETPAALLARWALVGCVQQTAPLLEAVGGSFTPLSLYLSSDRGRTPRYAIGEPISLVLQTNRAAHLYCFLNRDGAMLPLFPGPAGHIRTDGHEAIRVPGPDLTMRLDAGPPPGQSEIRCHATEEDVAPAVAAVLAETPADEAGRALEALFRDLGDTQVAASRLFVTVY
ncbi:hypothetical protein C882_2825 [Caenispirillum salinarum AK4]|uniref:DUF4384 domain-containing protein n=1 Tax=Caenispirillum salinarum AK4 TaxID=1238182 RepID=K9GK56_9PROT|nr:hypothetical protein C882_2825 [Caenispirillum salinarum AK4]